MTGHSVIAAKLVQGRFASKRSSQECVYENLKKKTRPWQRNHQGRAHIDTNIFDRKALGNHLI